MPFPAGDDYSLYEEMTRTNNELANLQREMARKNADLAAAQKKLQASEQRYRSLSACSPMGVLEMDAAGRCLYTNPQWQVISALSAEESLGDGWQVTLETAAAPAFLELWNLTRCAGLEFSREVRFATIDDNQRWGHFRARPIRGGGGEVTGHVTTVEDVTERKRAEKDLENAHRQLVDSSRQAGMAEVATSVLHNVGNVLNSVNVSCSVISGKVRQSRISSVAKMAELLRERASDLAGFLTIDPAGRKIPEFLGKLAVRLAEEQKAVLDEVESLSSNIEHIKNIVATQQSHAKHIGGVRETLPMQELLEDALRLNEGALSRHRIKVVREFFDAPIVLVEKHKVLQILINLLRNAKHALTASGREDKQLILRITHNHDLVVLSVIDNGIGIHPENLTRIFGHGFTTKKDGHGFGLHSGALAAQEMGGSLAVKSDGPGTGATFTLSLPIGAIK